MNVAKETFHKESGYFGFGLELHSIEIHQFSDGIYFSFNVYMNRRNMAITE